MSGLLVSVRSAAEAAAALAGGASVIDVKEPARGPLGAADPAVRAAVVAEVAGRVPVSAAMGELLGGAGDVGPGLAFAKWGLAGCRGRGDWAGLLLARRLGVPVVAVAYADADRADAPPPGEVAALAAGGGFAAFLIDTHTKDGSTLLDWLTVAAVGELVAGCRAAGVPVALAGSLGAAEIDALAGLRPDWFAVRGAACAGGRGGTVEAGRVAGLDRRIRFTPPHTLCRGR